MHGSDHDLGPIEVQNGRSTGLDFFTNISKYMVDLDMKFDPELLYAFKEDEWFGL